MFPRSTGPRNRLDRATRVVWNLLRAARRERAEIYHLHDPELLWVGILLKLLGHRVVYDVHEDSPKQIMNKFWIPSWARRVLAAGTELVERIAAGCSTAIVTATPSSPQRFPAGKTIVVQNFPRIAAARVRDQRARRALRRSATVRISPTRGSYGGRRACARSSRPPRCCRPTSATP